MGDPWISYGTLMGVKYGPVGIPWYAMLPMGRPWAFHVLTVLTRGCLCVGHGSLMWLHMSNA